MNDLVIVTSVGCIESIWKQGTLNLDAPEHLVPCTGSASLFWMDFEKKPRGDWKETCGLWRGRAVCAHGGCAPLLAARCALAGRFPTVGSGYRVSVGGCSFLLYCNLKTLSTLDLPQDEIGRAGNDIAHTFITTRS